MSNVVTKTFKAFSTVFTITTDEKNEEFVEEIEAYVLALDNLMNAYNEDSEISKINDNAAIGPVAVSKELYEVIEASLDYAKETEGIFDISIFPLTLLWKVAIMNKKLPDPNAIMQAKALVGYKDIELIPEDNAIFLNKEGVAIELGAISKGYVLDKVIENIIEPNKLDVLINFGGIVYVSGSEKTIGIQHPFRENGVSMAKLKAKNKMIVTSGLSEENFVKADNKYHSIISPKTGYPSTSPLASVTLVGDNGAMLDAYATAAFILGVDRGYELIRSKGIEAIFILKDGQVVTTQNIKKDMDFRS